MVQHFITRRKGAALSQVGPGRRLVVALFQKRPSTSHSLLKMVVSSEQLCLHTGLKSHAGVMHCMTKEMISVQLRVSMRQLNASGPKKRVARLRLSDPNLEKPQHCGSEALQQQRDHQLSRQHRRIPILQCRRQHTPTCR